MEHGTRLRSLSPCAYRKNESVNDPEALGCLGVVVNATKSRVS